MELPPAIVERLSDAVKSSLSLRSAGHFQRIACIPDSFRQPDAAECPPVKEVTALAQRVGAIACYPYLGDIGESPTGDKKAEKYEDEWLDELFAALPSLGFQGSYLYAPAEQHHPT